MGSAQQIVIIIVLLVLLSQGDVRGMDGMRERREELGVRCMMGDEVAVYLNLHFLGTEEEILLCGSCSTYPGPGQLSKDLDKPAQIPFMHMGLRQGS